MALKKGSAEAKQYMLKLRNAKKTAAKKPVVKKKVVKKQTGTTNKAYDLRKQALPVGKRTSKSGNVYYESRANRSDRGKLMGVRLTKAQALKKLTELGNNSKSPLAKKVASIIKYNSYDYNNLEDLFEEIRMGLQNGSISELIYYKDTLAWYKKYKKEINNLLKEKMYEYGVNSPYEIFGSNWDKDDFLAEETYNQNLLTWFSFEEISNEFANQLGY